MGRYIGPKNKIARRFGVNLGLKTNATKVARRLSKRPGVHGLKKTRRTTSNYGAQLLEKQKAKYVYGLRERQFARYVAEASRREGDSSVNLVQLLETRLDNVVYRLGFATTRAQARQFVSHGMFLVNDKKMNIPSYHVILGDIIRLKPNKADKGPFAQIDEQLANRDIPGWLSLDIKTKIAKVLNAPRPEDGENAIDVKLIIEFYSSH
ncbi:MAG TPA: 30S ribosomal protein S4 [Candidatus Magasanikbacteria bacterium]|nr:MAG: 30S ribosomal protein S4 [Candidatus Magasanikbacteria bacterium RIFCSPLOWO2_02_FULL_47_16]OGH80070.1 MAG: 30S ribosomal protein S4 [Candidatus Magasanikbacteria bacterium RIFCSPHIGHO2_02_FULL_48_18]OGH82830.1 MAG: 30S ribosomal protein S4 [Candidatus Magasanikbacteria bacterium RIFCSPLOWO2_12_FULL_47_9b]HAZ28448.1 30S ribosomal protein S4 [Candidatus Magasanikbacteria bacterium]